MQPIERAERIAAWINSVLPSAFVTAFKTPVTKDGVETTHIASEFMGERGTNAVSTAETTWERNEATLIAEVLTKADKTGERLPAVDHSDTAITVRSVLREAREHAHGGDVNPAAALIEIAKLMAGSGISAL